MIWLNASLLTLARALSSPGSSTLQLGTTRQHNGLHHAFVCIACRSTEDVEDVRREVQIMHHLAGHPNVTLLKGAYEDRHHVHLVRTPPPMRQAALTLAAMVGM